MNDNKKSVCIVGSVVNVAEHKTYLELVSRVCYYDEPNLNGDMLPYNDDSFEKGQTLINMPVQGKYRVNKDGEPTFGSHEMVKHEDGSVDFGTQSIGTHTDIYIKNDDVVTASGETKNLPCLFAKYRIWKRYKNVVAAVRRLFKLGKLYSSWEINVYAAENDSEIHKISDYEFLSNCLLGYEYAFPSYGENANAISIAEKNNDRLMIAEALSQDLLDKKNIKDKEEYQLSNKTDIKTSAEKANDIENKDTPTVSQLTDFDLWQKLDKACRNKLDKLCWVTFFFPNEKEVWVEVEGRETSLDYVKFTYDVSDDDKITLSEPENVKLTVSVSEINSKIEELSKSAETAKAEVDIKNDAIIKASGEIQSLKSQIAALEPYKEQVEESERLKIEEQISAEKEELKNKVIKSGLFTESEIAEKSMCDLIEERNTSEINNLIAERFMASLEKDHECGSKSADGGTAAVAQLDSHAEEPDIRSFMEKVLF